MKARRTHHSDKVFRLDGGNEDNDLWTHTYDQDGPDASIGSVWELSPEERAAVAGGANIELIVFGSGHPPVTLRTVHYALGKRPESEDCE